MEREPGRLQLRVPLRGREGVCSVLVDEDDESVTVLVLVCGEGDSTGGWVDCPVHVVLDQPLGNRTVRDLVRQRRRVAYRNVYRDLERDFGPPGAEGISS